VEKAFTERNWLGLGEYKKLTPQDAYKIVEMSY
jgi:NADP-dependent alcohol dehydrogenase